MLFITKELGYDMIRKKMNKRKKLGPLGRKILLCLAAGVTLSLVGRPNQYFRIIEATAKEWQKINQRNLRRAIRKLYQSNLVNCVDNKDGTTSVALSRDGKTQTIRLNLEDVKIKRTTRWDGLWRIVIFDIPEHQKRARDALSFRLKQMGMLPIQRSVFISPFDCRDEIDFVVETFAVKPHVRYIVAKEIDIALELKRKFRIA